MKYYHIKRSLKVIYIQLPNLFECINQNLAIKYLSDNYISYFKIPVSFNYVGGNFPYTIAAIHNNNSNQSASYENILQIFNKYSQCNIISNLDFSNLLLTEDDLNNEYLNCILSLYNNGSNLLEISDLNILNAIKKKFPYYRFNINNFNQINDYDDLNALLENDSIAFVNLNPNTKLNLQKIKNKTKTTITLNPKHCYFCDKQLECLFKENIKVKEFSTVSIINNCSSLFKTDTKLQLEDYIKMGYHNFKFETVIPQAYDSLLLFYLNYFIKPEYLSKALMILKEQHYL